MTALGPDLIFFIETNSCFPRAKPHSKAVKHTVLLRYWKPFVSGMLPSHNTSEERVPRYDTTPGLTIPYAQRTAYAQHNRSS